MFIKVYDFFQFFSKTSYVIGGELYSLNDIENGILRGNKKGPVQVFKPFGSNDLRRTFALPEVSLYFYLFCFLQQIY